MLQCVAVSCSVLQCLVVCCSALQCVTVCCRVLQCVAVCCSVLRVRMSVDYYKFEASADSQAVCVRKTTPKRNHEPKKKSSCVIGGFK